MAQAPKRLIITIFAVLIWAAITMGGGLIQAGPGTSLGSLVTEQILWGTPAAAAFIFVVAAAFGWKDLGLNKPKTTGIWKFIWLPMLYILAFLGTGLTSANFSLTTNVVLIVMLNTMVVGFSEELAFRGLLWSSVRNMLPFWGAALFVCLCFGSVHIANALLTGEFGGALQQALFAGMSGMSFLAIRIRTGSLYPAMLVHFLWDFGIFLMGAGKSSETAVESSAVSGLAVGLILIGPVFLFGLYLVRNERVRAGWRDDS